MNARGSARTRTLSTPGEDASEPGTRALALALAATLALRAVAPLLPGRWLWGADLGRDLPTAAFWAAWAASALVLAPFISRPLARALPTGGRGTAVMGVALALAMGALAWHFPERLYFTGDTWLRKGDFAGTPHPLAIVPQAMPGDIALHWFVPRWFVEHAGRSAWSTERAWGAGLALVQGLLAWDFARRRGYRGAAALAAIAIAGWTASLALFNGYAKGLVELAVLQVAAASALLSARRGGRGAIALGLVTAAALVMHRMGLALLPAWALALAWTARRPGGRGWREPAFLLGLVPPLLALGVLAPRLASALGGFDLAHHVVPPGAPASAVLVRALSPLRLLDVANLLLLLVPALPLLAMLPAARRNAPPAGDGALFAALIVPQLALVLVLQPQHGLFRDWDVFACLGASLALWLAARTGDLLTRVPRAAWLAIPTLLVAAVPATQWLAHQSDLERGYQRARDVLQGPPARSDVDRATGFDQLSLVLLAHEQGERAAETCSLSVAATPNPRVYVQWGMAETIRGRPEAALQCYLAATRLRPEWAMAWKGVAAASSALGDVGHMQQAVTALRALEPSGATTRDAQKWLEDRRPAPSSPTR